MRTECSKNKSKGMWILGKTQILQLLLVPNPNWNHRCSQHSFQKCVWNIEFGYVRPNNYYECFFAPNWTTFDEVLIVIQWNNSLITIVSGFFRFSMSQITFKRIKNVLRFELIWLKLKWSVRQFLIIFEMSFKVLTLKYQSRGLSVEWVARVFM